MNFLGLQILKALDVVPKSRHLQIRENRTLNSLTNSSHVVIESCRNAAIHIQAFPIKENGNNLNLTDSWEMFLKENGPHTSTKFLICSWRSSLANPLKSPFSFNRCNIVLAMWNIAIPLTEGKQLDPNPQ